MNRTDSIRTLRRILRAKANARSLTDRELADLSRFARFVTIKRCGCMVWTGCTRDSDYGAFKVEGRVHLSHRWLYTLLVGPIGTDPETGESLTLDHVDGLCTSTLCVNPGHMEPVTRAENSRREGRSRARRAA